jgi:hypothetical protein
VDHEGRDGRFAPGAAGRAARGGRRLTDLLQRSFGLSGTATPQELKARYRSLAQRCAQPDAPPDEIERLRVASVALAQELVFIGFDRAQVEQALVDEGCPPSVAADGAAAIAGTVSRRVKSPLEREFVSPVDAAYARLADRTVAAESARNMTPSSYGLGFIVKLAVSFAVIMGALIASLDYFPRILRPAKVEAAPVQIQLLPAENPKK